MRGTWGRGGGVTGDSNGTSVASLGGIVRKPLGVPSGAGGPWREFPKKRGGRDRPQFECKRGYIGQIFQITPVPGI